MVARIGGWRVCLTLAALAAACGGNGEGRAAPTPAATATSEVATTQASEAADNRGDQGGTPEVYTVRSGDTLSTIARQFDTTVAALVEANDIADPDVIDVGQKLRIPPQ